MKIRRNRKKFSREAAGQAPFFLALGLAAVAAFAYLWLNQRCEALGRRLSQLDAQKAELQRQIKQERSRWESAKSLDQVEKLLLRHHLTMAWPDERNIIRIRRVADEPSAAEPAASRRQYARAGGVAHD